MIRQVYQRPVVEAPLLRVLQRLDVVIVPAERHMYPRQDLLDWDDVVVSLDWIERQVSLEVVRVALSGNTVRLTAQFETVDGIQVEPTSVKLVVYDGDKSELLPATIVAPSGVGFYQYDYVVPDDATGPLSYEFNGELAGKPILGRGWLDKEWA